MCINHWPESVKKTEPAHSHGPSRKGKGQQTQIETQEIPFRCHKKHFTGRAVEHRSRLARESSSLETFKIELQKS